jgi:hypothetical protein
MAVEGERSRNRERARCSVNCSRRGSTRMMTSGIRKSPQLLNPRVAPQRIPKYGREALSDLLHHTLGRLYVVRSDSATMPHDSHW